MNEREANVEHAKMEIGASILELQFVAQRMAEALQRMSRAYQTVALGTMPQHVETAPELEQ